MSDKSDGIEKTILKDLWDHGPSTPQEIHQRHKKLPLGMLRGFLGKLQSKQRVTNIDRTNRWGKWEVK